MAARHAPSIPTAIRDQADQVHGRREGGGGLGRQTGRSPAVDAHRSRCCHGSPIPTLLRGALQLAVLNNVLGTNPVRDVQSIKSKEQPKGAPALTADQLRDLLAKLKDSEACQKRDLTDPITLLIATGLRRSELPALRWTDFDADAGTISISGKLIREKAQGLVQVDETKTAAGRRVIPLPAFAIATLTERALPRSAISHLPVHERHTARPR